MLFSKPYESGRKYWWQCKKDPKHEWSATVSIRTVRGVVAHIAPVVSKKNN